jgi:hypothetical protein
MQTNFNKDSGWCSVVPVMMEQAAVWNNAGPVRTQNDMSEEEIRAIEARYNAPVIRDTKIEVREPIESYVHDSWYKIRKRERERKEQQCAA